MPTDLVVDTNVLVHADNDQEPRQKQSIDFINRLLTSEEIICMDEGFDFIESQNRSHIGGEYLEHLRFGMQGWALIIKLAQDNRIVFLPRAIPAAINKKINMTGIKKSDRIFVRIAFNSTDQILVSHDYEDFSDAIRKYLYDKIEVLVVESNQI